MCVVTGLFNLNHSPSPGLILEMTQALKHRDPNNEGYLALTKESDGLRASPLRGPDSSANNESPCESFNGKALGFLGHRRAKHKENTIRSSC